MGGGEEGTRAGDQEMWDKSGRIFKVIIRNRNPLEGNGKDAKMNSSSGGVTWLSPKNTETSISIKRQVDPDTTSRKRREGSEPAWTEINLSNLKRVAGKKATGTSNLSIVQKA